MTANVSRWGLGEGTLPGGFVQASKKAGRHRSGLLWFVVWLLRCGYRRD